MQCPISDPGLCNMVKYKHLLRMLVDKFDGLRQVPLPFLSHIQLNDARLQPGCRRSESDFSCFPSWPNNCKAAAVICVRSLRPEARNILRIRTSGSSQIACPTHHKANRSNRIRNQVPFVVYDFCFHVGQIVAVSRNARSIAIRRIFVGLHAVVRLCSAMGCLPCRAMHDPEVNSIALLLADFRPVIKAYSKSEISISAPPQFAVVARAGLVGHTLRPTVHWKGGRNSSLALESCFRSEVRRRTCLDGCRAS